LPSPIIKWNVINRFLYPLIAFAIISCKTSSPVVNSELKDNQNETTSFNLVEHQMHLIDSYISRIDSKAKDKEPVNVNELIIHNNVRKITSNEFNKDVVLKNKDIVRVKYKNHLHNNFIKSRIFYYDKNELVCIKIQEVIPNQFNKNTLYQRTIYLQDSKPLIDTDKENAENSTVDLINQGMNHLQYEYKTLK